MRVFLILLDSFGVGALPDAHLYGDAGSNTAESVMHSPYFHCPNLMSMGLGNLPYITAKPTKALGCYGMAAQASVGKDTITGHWELMGVITKELFPLFPQGFPDELIQKIGGDVLCNLPYSGTEVIRDYGSEHIKTKKPIIYTSADSVLQVACHEDILPPDKLYEYCQAMRAICVGKYRVARVIARPFNGKEGDFYRTSGRRDYAVSPPQNALDLIKNSGKEVIAIGKIKAIFNGNGITKSYETKNNNEGMATLSLMQGKDFTGLCFANLVDFDMLYGHRNDIDGYAKAMSDFDKWLGEFIKNKRNDDLLIITADHGCDPATPSTDHSREYVPILCLGGTTTNCNIGTRASFADVGATICHLFDIKLPQGASFHQELRS